MPKLTKTAQEQSLSTLQDSLEDILISGEMRVVCGVNRKINTGNFENIDVYAGIALPMQIQLKASERELLEELAHHLAEVGFAITSKETGDRYQLIKDMQKGGRDSK